MTDVDETPIIIDRFTFENKQVRTIIVNNDIWFCGRDIAGILEYKDKVDAIKVHVDDDDKETLKLLCKNTQYLLVDKMELKIFPKYNWIILFIKIL